MNRKRLVCIGIWMLLLLCAFPALAAETRNVSTYDELKQAFADLSANGGEMTVILEDDITLSQSSNVCLSLTNGTMTLLGNNHSLCYPYSTTVNVIEIGNASVLNLGSPTGEGGTLTISQLDTTSHLITLKTGTKDAHPVLNMYDGVTLGPSRATYYAAGVTIFNRGEFNMYGGTIKDCFGQGSGVGCGAVEFAGSYNHFNMYGGVIENCGGNVGGAVSAANGVSDTHFDMYGGVIRDCYCTGEGGGAYTAYQRNIDGSYFTMHDGLIENCTGKYGGAVSYTTLPGNYYAQIGKFVMNGGKIVNCSATEDGGAIYLAESYTAELNGGEITGCTAQRGGGIYLAKQARSYLHNPGTVTLADGFLLHSNTASVEGDDIALELNETKPEWSGKAIIGEVNNRCTADCDHRIVGYYPDTADDHYGEVEAPGTINNVTGLKAAHGHLTEVAMDLDHDGIVEIQYVPDGLDALLPETPVWRGRKFLGWFTSPTDDTPYDFSLPVTSEMTLYARWEDAPEPVVSPSPRPCALGRSYPAPHGRQHSPGAFAGAAVRVRLDAAAAGQARKGLWTLIKMEQNENEPLAQLQRLVFVLFHCNQAA